MGRFFVPGENAAKDSAGAGPPCARAGGPGFTAWPLCAMHDRNPWRTDGRGDRPPSSRCGVCGDAGRDGRLRGQGREKTRCGGRRRRGPDPGRRCGPVRRQCRAGPGRVCQGQAGRGGRGPGPGTRLPGASGRPHLPPGPRCLPRRAGGPSGRSRGPVRGRIRGPDAARRPGGRGLFRKGPGASPRPCPVGQDARAGPPPGPGPGEGRLGPAKDPGNRWRRRRHRKQPRAGPSGPGPLGRGRGRLHHLPGLEGFPAHPEQSGAGPVPGRAFRRGLRRLPGRRRRGRGPQQPRGLLPGVGHGGQGGGGIRGGHRQKTPILSHGLGQPGTDIDVRPAVPGGPEVPGSNPGKEEGLPRAGGEGKGVRDLARRARYAGKETPDPGAGGRGRGHGRGENPARQLRPAPPRPPTSRRSRRPPAPRGRQANPAHPARPMRTVRPARDRPRPEPGKSTSSTRPAAMRRGPQRREARGHARHATHRLPRDIQPAHRRR